MKNVKSFLFLLFFTDMITACHKAGTGGDVTLDALPFHHAKPIPYTIVYIKYGAKTFPGTDVSKYDDNKIAYPQPGGNPCAVFPGLYKGDYFLYGTGFDSSLGLPVTGGIPIVIKQKSGVDSVRVPITEL